MNLALEKGERVTTGGKGRSEIGGEAGEVNGVAADAPTTDGLGKRYGTFSGWWLAAGKVEVLLVVGGFDVDGGAEARLVNKISLSYKMLILLQKLRFVNKIFPFKYHVFAPMGKTC